MAGHLSNQTWYNKQRPFVRLNGYGDMIPGSIVFRDRMPKAGVWRELGFINACCNGIGDSYIVVENTTGSANITGIVSADGKINFSGAIANGGMMVFVIPGGINESIQFTVNTPAGRTLTYTAAQGDGTLSPASPLTGTAINTTPVLTSASPNTQYRFILS